MLPRLRGCFWKWVFLLLAATTRGYDDCCFFCNHNLSTSWLWLNGLFQCSSVFRSGRLCFCSRANTRSKLRLFAFTIYQQQQFLWVPFVNTCNSFLGVVCLLERFNFRRKKCALVKPHCIQVAKCATWRTCFGKRLWNCKRARRLCMFTSFASADAGYDECFLESVKILKFDLFLKTGFACGQENFFLADDSAKVVIYWWCTSRGDGLEVFVLQQGVEVNTFPLKDSP